MLEKLARTKMHAQMSLFVQFIIFALCRLHMSSWSAFYFNQYANLGFELLFDHEFVWLAHEFVCGLYKAYIIRVNGLRGANTRKSPLLIFWNFALCKYWKVARGGCLVLRTLSHSQTPRAPSL